MRRLAVLAVPVLIGVAATILTSGSSRATASAGPPSQHPTQTPVPTGIHKIQHVVVIMQENRSFDSYFGTFPGADGIPHDGNGVPTVCSPDPRRDPVSSHITIAATAVLAVRTDRRTSMTTWPQVR